MYDKSDIMAAEVRYLGKTEADPFWDSWEKEVLTPSYHGERCIGNGEDPGVECCCDECNFFLHCFPEWDKAKTER